MGKLLVLDPTVAGVSGDMLVAALVDLGGSVRVLEALSNVISKLPPVKRFEVEVEDRVTWGVRAKRLRIRLDEGRDHTTGGELLKWFETAANGLGLEGSLKDRAKEALMNLLIAEAKVHNSTPYDVHLHEVGSVDTLFDILAFAALVNDLKLDDALRYSLPVAVGGGTVKSAHGLIPSPAYITLEVLKNRNYHIIGGPIDEELTTPTGAALLATFFEPLKYFPLMKVTRIGYGCGSKEFSNVPNVVRAVLGEFGEVAPRSLKYEKVYVLESNVDDVTGEVIGYSIEKLMSLGALDVSVIPVTTKKCRPGHIFRVLSDEQHVRDLLMAMVRELGTLGVRVSEVGRYVLPVRDFKDLRIDLGRGYDVRVKVCKDGEGNVVRVKPEFEDLKRIANELNIPLRELLEKLSKELWVRALNT